MLRRLNVGFAVIMVVYGGVVFLVYRDEVLGPFLRPLAELTASVTEGLVRLLGIEVLRAGAIIKHPDGFGFEIAYICTGFLPVVTFVVCVMAYPGPLARKWAGIAFGIPALLAVNFLRLVSLFYIGVRFPALFGLAHEVVWEGLLAVVFIALWVGWMRWSNDHGSDKRGGFDTSRLSRSMR